MTPAGSVSFRYNCSGRLEAKDKAKSGHVPVIDNITRKGTIICRAGQSTAAGCHSGPLEVIGPGRSAADSRGGAGSP